MIELTSEEIEYWRERADEPITGEPVIMTAEEQAEFEREHPMPTQEEIQRLLKEVQDA